MSLLHKSVLPQAQKESYGQNEDIFFHLNFEGQSIIRDSVRLCGRLKFENITTAYTATLSPTTIDGVCGIHGAFSSCVVTDNNGRTLENARYYP